MDTLTKICVVILVPLVLMACVVFVNLTARLNEARKEIVKQEQNVADLQLQLVLAEQRGRAFVSFRDHRDADYREILERMAKLERDLKAAQAKNAPTTSEPSINGTVTAIKDDIIQLNIGSSQGVCKGMMMIVYRDTHFVGRVEITEVRAETSSGQLQDKQLEPRRGDKVTGGLQ